MGKRILVTGAGRPGGAQALTGTRAPVSRRLEIRGALDRRAVESLEIEIRRLAKRHGVVIEEIRIEPRRPWPGVRSRRVVSLSRRRARPPRRGPAT